MTMSDLKHLSLVTAEGNFRAKVRSILADMEGAGFEPKIAESVRTVAQQREKVRKGYSKTMNSKHLPGADMLARAVDVCDLNTGWAAKRTFWLTLGRCALLHDCDWGGLWGLSLLQRSKLKRFLLDRSKPWNPDDWNGPMGWDTAHVQKR